MYETVFHYERFDWFCKSCQEHKTLIRRQKASTTWITLDGDYHRCHPIAVEERKYVSSMCPPGYIFIWDERDL